MQGVIEKEELDVKEKEVSVDFSLDYFYQELEKVINVRILRIIVKSLHGEGSNTKDEVFLDENYFITFIYETLESTSDLIRSNIFLLLIQHQKSR